MKKLATSPSFILKMTNLNHVLTDWRHQLSHIEVTDFDLTKYDWWRRCLFRVCQPHFLQNGCIGCILLFLPSLFCYIMNYSKTNRLLYMNMWSASSVNGYVAFGYFRYLSMKLILTMHSQYANQLVRPAQLQGQFFSDGQYLKYYLKYI